MQRKIAKNYILFLTIILTGIIVLPYLPNQAKALPEQAITTSPNTLNPSPIDPFAKALNKDKSYLLVNTSTGEKLLAENEDIQRPPASTVKLLTGMVVMEKLKEDDLIKVGEEVRNIEGSQLGLLPKDEILVKDLLTALYLESANDAATALAIAAYGTLDDFLIAMNNYAVKIDCKNSQFKTPNGLPYPDQYTTASDLAKIAQEFIAKDNLMKYVKMKEATVRWTRYNSFQLDKVVKNTNQLLGIYPGDIGLKTGTTTEAGQCLVTYIERPDANLLLVLLGSQQRYKDTIELLDQGISRIRTSSALKNITSDPDSLITSPGFFAP